MASCPYERYRQIKEAFNTRSKDVRWSIINDNAVPVYKRTVEVRLNKRVDRDTLRAIALKLTKESADTFERTFIGYFLRENDGSGAWATTHFNPGLEVKILGLTAHEAAMLAKRAHDPSQEVIGSWIHDRPHLGYRITFFRRNKKLFMETAFKDGSSRECDIVARNSAKGRKFEEVERNEFDEYYLIDKKGNLEFWDRDGRFYVALRTPDIKSTLSASAIKTQKKKRPQDRPKKQPRTTGQRFLSLKLRELDSFKSTPAFEEFGFAIGGPFSSWLKQVESKRDSSDFTVKERIAVGDLIGLGLQYVNLGGEENDYSKFARRQIRRVIQNNE